MFGDMYSQMMRARLGVGKPMEGYGMTPMQTVPQQPQPYNGGFMPPWMQHGGGMPRNTPFEPRPQGGTIPMESPWNPRQTPYEPRPKDNGMEDGSPSGQGYMGGFKNPWQRF